MWGSGVCIHRDTRMYPTARIEVGPLVWCVCPGVFPQGCLHGRVRLECKGTAV